MVYAEGSKTEPLYIENIKEELAKRNNCQVEDLTINTVPKSGGHNTLDLIEYAEKDVLERRKNNEKIDFIWIFYDKDSFDKDQFDNSYHKIISKNKDSHKKKNEFEFACDKFGTVWNACWSNESFELWVFLHFQYLTSSLSRKQYISKINAFLKAKGAPSSDLYQKTRPDLYTLLNQYGDVKMAKRYAERLNLALENEKVKTNPSTGIYL
ncbi:MAG TPA: RloB family protein, partial [Bacillota bacterium]|nr:RloB family protein [Bacillota bacterium]